MLELILIAGGVAAAYFSYTAGIKEGEKSTLETIHDTIHAGMVSDTPFAKAYGRAGFYLTDVHHALPNLPLAVISSSNLLDLIARERLGDDAEEASIALLKEQLADSYFLAKGMTPQALKDIKDIDAQLRQPSNDI
ncbi:hypothetical protein [Litchfieldella rifensis]|uniref:Uncharacterized protein n=1 Tax=Litchfieldella rifensis TaxID=762643 RepID=A0ABV7LKK3_9GAMM